jgi:hypothetical protein
MWGSTIILNRIINRIQSHHNFPDDYKSEIRRKFIGKIKSQSMNDLLVTFFYKGILNSKRAMYDVMWVMREDLKFE